MSFEIKVPLGYFANTNQEKSGGGSGFHNACLWADVAPMDEEAAQLLRCRVFAVVVCQATYQNCSHVHCIRLLIHSCDLRAFLLSLCNSSVQQHKTARLNCRSASTLLHLNSDRPHRALPSTPQGSQQQPKGKSQEVGRFG